MILLEGKREGGRERGEEGQREGEWWELEWRSCPLNDDIVGGSGTELAVSLGKEALFHLR